MGEAEVSSRRRGGRAARRELRAAPIPESARPVRPGLAGGRYHPLTDSEVQRVHGAALDVLEQIGFANPIPSCVELMTAAGAELTAEGRLVVPRALVEDTLAKAARNIVLHAADPGLDMELSGTRVHFGTAGAAVHVVDPETGAYRDSTLEDLYDMARLADALEHIHFFQRPVVARDMVAPRDLDLNTCYACVAGTQKHVGTSFVEPDHVEESLAMLHAIAGGEAAWRARPFVSISCCFVVPPMTFAEDACR